MHSGEKIDVTIAICTWNRADLLRQTLGRMADCLEVPPDLRWELLVVNNASTDRTEEVLAEMAQRLPLRPLFEATLGLSAARNRAIAEASGTYIIWTDDDVLVEPAWLKAYWRAFREHPEAAVFGGPIDPWFAGKQPHWLARAWEHVREAYATRDLGEHRVALSTDEVPFGANMAIRRAEQLGHPFDLRYGNRGENPIGGEETRVVRGILDGGGSGVWVPGARLVHYIPESRQTTTFLEQYYRGSGRRRRIKEAGRSVSFGKKLKWYVRVAKGTLLYWIGRSLGRPEVWVPALRLNALARGYLMGDDRAPRGK